MWRATVASMLLGMAGGGAVLLYWPSHTARIAAASYEEAAHRQDWPAALEAAERWAAVRPASADAWLGVAEAARQLRQFPRTADALGRLPDHDRRRLKALALRGDLLLSELRQPREAIAN